MNKPSSTYRIQFHKDFNFKSLEKIIPYLIDLGVGTLYASPIFEASPGSTHGYDVVNPLKINPEIGTEQELVWISKKLKDAGIAWLQDIVPNHMAFHPANKWLMDVLENGMASRFAPFFDIDLEKGDGRLMVPFLEDDLMEAIEHNTLILKKIKGKFYLRSGDSDWPLNASTSEKLSHENLKKLNKDNAYLKEIADGQYYRLCNWQETNGKINYRRFFTVNSLICLNIQHQQVFDVYHKYIFELIDKGIFQGLRIDHIDGLYDPKQYLDRLRKAVGKEIYIVVEKILESGEEIPADWDIQGTTGYDFLAKVNNLFTDKQGEKFFNKLYQLVTEKKLNPQELIHQKKTAILFDHMHGELNNLYALFASLGLEGGAGINAEELKAAIAEMLIQMPVYRYYNYDFPLNNEDSGKVKKLLRPILKDKKVKKAGALLLNVLIDRPLECNPEYNQKVKQFYQRFMQFSGPLMAKGVEDTVMFTYNRFVGHTEVGDAPDAFGLTKDEFHDNMLARQNHWPLSMNGSSTHDTKKGEDVRARLNVLSDIPKDWSDLVGNLQQSVAGLQKIYPAFKWLHKNDVYLILQTIIGALPFSGEDSDDIDIRLEQFIQKALREAKKRSNWAEPNEQYEAELKKFSHALLDKKHTGRAHIKEFLKQISDFAVINSLAQLILKFTCPGVPDIYQGTELWDLSLVDPDNRRPVDYGLRTNFIHQLNEDFCLKNLWEERFSGKIKLWFTRTLLNIRKSEADIFFSGAYIPLEIKGKFSGHIFAFARKEKNNWIVTVVPLGLIQLCKNQGVSADKIDWVDTQVVLPPEAPSGWTNLLTLRTGRKDFPQNSIPIPQLFNYFPIALIKLVPKNNDRSAGILMHISSLPSKFGIGDLGTNAFRFVDFLYESRQKYWQILPLNPTVIDTGCSPYSSSSAMAGNILLISPESLCEDGLLNEKDLKASELPETNHIDFIETEKTKRKLLIKAYRNFSKNGDNGLKKEYKIFCITESDWLDDFSTYMAIKGYCKNLKWYEWPKEYKYRDAKTLSDFGKSNQKAIEEIKWKQFFFYRQWHRLKKYANKKGIEVIGDLPFYLDYDSVEVWSQPSNFLLDKNMNRKKVAGVPPDYFNEKGQLWGMPIFNWRTMKKDNYLWWLTRLKKNLELYDLVRLDHFRAFSSYWEVSPQYQDAINGAWVPGPGAEFFQIIEESLGKLPFIAEDLGEITDDVERLRKQVKLPGMKVLQFSFGKDLAASPHIPFNFASTNCIVYSGTHDNNTLKGWFKNEVDAAKQKRISEYTGIEVDGNNINKAVIKLCYSSIAKIAIIPIQDIFALDEGTRMNIPGTSEGNWTWKATPELLDQKASDWLKLQAELYGRST